MQAGDLSIPDFELLRQIGRGAYGDVWLARSVTGIHRAVKIVYRDRFEEARPFEREFAGIKRFEPISRSQENLIDILHVGRKDDWNLFYYVMELADSAEAGGVIQTGTEEWVQAYRPKTLREVLPGRKRLPIEDCLPIAVALTRGARHLHDHGLIHRDIKPSNVIFVNGIPKLADIGLVSALEESRSFVGTEGFVPPEGPGTYSSDLYSLGKVFYEMSTGRDRLEFPKLPEELETLPHRESLLEFNEVVVKACHSNPKERYAAASDMLDDLLLLQAGRSVKRLRIVEKRLARLIPMGLSLAGIGVAALLFQQFKTREAQQLARVENSYRRQAEAQALATRQLLYAADMNLAHQAYVEGDLGRARSLLASYLPKPGSPDLRGFEWRYFWNLAQGDQAITFAAEAYPIAELVYSPDRRWLAAAAYDHRAEIWDPQTRRLLYQFPTAGPVEDIGFSPDGTDLAISDGSGCVEVKEIQTGRSVFRLADKPRRMSISPVEPWLALGGGGRQAIGNLKPEPTTVWDYHSQRVIYRFPETGTYVAFSPDGGRLATGSWNGTLKIWSMKDGRLLTSLSPVERNFGMSFSPDGRRLAVGDEQGALHLWNLESGVQVASVQAHAGNIFKTAFSPEGRIIASVGADQKVRLADAQSLAEIRTLRGHASEVWGLAFSTDGRTLNTSGKDGTIRIWDLQQPPRNPVVSRDVSFWDWPVFSADGHLLAVGEKKAGIKVWRAADNEILATLPEASRPLAFGADDQTLLALGSQNELQQWSLSATNARLLKTASLPAMDVRAHVVVPEHKLLITGDEAGDVRLWDIDSGEEQGRWKAHPDHITTMALSPDHTLLVTASESEEDAKIWRIPQHQLLSALRGHKMIVYAVCFSPDGDSIATASVDDTCRLWDAHTGRCLAVLEGHKGGAYGVAFSPDGKTLAVGCNEGELKLWNLATRRDMMTLAAEPHALFWVAFGSDGHTLATVSYNHHNDACSLQLWRAPSE